MTQQFTADFEEKIVQAILVDPMFGEQILEVMEPECFDLAWTKEISNRLMRYYSRFRNFPSVSLLKDIVEQEVNDPISRTECLSYIEKIQNRPLNGDSDYIKDKALAFFRKQHIKNALLNEVIPLMKNSELDQILPIIQSALNKGTNSDIGYDYKEDMNDRFEEHVEAKVPTLWPQINAMLGGGWEGKRLATIIGASGAGKSFVLVNTGVGALLAGKTVVHYTLELSFVDVARRYDACLTGVEINHVPRMRDVVLRKLSETLPEDSHLIIKEYPMKSASIQTIKAHLSKLKLNGIEPDIIVIDYGDLLASVKEFREERHGLSTIWEGLKTLAQEMNIPVVTATQSNRSGYNSDILTPDQVSEDFKKIMHSDIIITIARNMEQKISGIGKMLFAKNRQGQDGQILAYKLLTHYSKFSVFEMTPEVEDEIKDAVDRAQQGQVKENHIAMDSYLKKIQGDNYGI